MENIFKFTRFPESFILCEKFNIEDVLCIDDSMFEFSDLPQWVTADRYDDTEVIEELKYKNPRIKECIKLLVNLFKEDVYTYEEARNLSKTLIGNEQVEKELKESLLKIEGKKNFVKEIQAKDIIDTPITIKETGNIVEIPEEQIR